MTPAPIVKLGAKSTRGANRTANQAGDELIDALAKTDARGPAEPPIPERKMSAP
jgi:hypothetical protein